MLLLVIESFSERLDWFGLRDSASALFASTACIVFPEVEHGFAEMFDNVGAVEIDVFDQRAAIVAIKDHMLVLARWTAPLNDHADRLRRPDGRVWNIGRNEKSFTFAHQMIDNLVAFTDAHLNVPLQLVEILFRIDEVKIIPRVRPFDHHHEEIATVVEIAIAHRRLKFLAVFFDPILQINRRLHSLHHAERIGTNAQRQTGMANGKYRGELRAP